MFAHISTRSTGLDRGKPASTPGWLVALAAVAIVLMTQACSSRAPPSPFTGPDPSDPQTVAPPVTYRSTVGGYVGRRPAEPRAWSEQNQTVAPADKP